MRFEIITLAYLMWQVFEYDNCLASSQIHHFVFINGKDINIQS